MSVSIFSGEGKLFEKSLSSRSESWLPTEPPFFQKLLKKVKDGVLLVTVSVTKPLSPKVFEE